MTLKDICNIKQKTKNDIIINIIIIIIINNICLYHTFRCFRREITTEKLGISSTERLHVLELLSQMTYLKPPTEYSKLLEMLKKKLRSHQVPVGTDVLQRRDIQSGRNSKQQVRVYLSQNQKCLF